MGKNIKDIKNPLSPFIQQNQNEDLEYLPSIERAKANANKLMKERHEKRVKEIIKNKQSEKYKMWEAIKKLLIEKIVPFVSKFLARWILKAIGSILGYIGITEDKLEGIIIAALCWIIGMIWSLVVDKKSLRTPVQE